MQMKTKTRWQKNYNNKSYVIKNFLLFFVQQVEDEWKEIEEEQRKDYSGLKIGQLTLNDEENDSESEGHDDDGDSDGNQNSEFLIRGDGAPWKKVIPAEEVTQIPMEMPKPASKVYVSPALRAAVSKQNRF